MKLDGLIKMLLLLQAEGHGHRQVKDDRGNDVAEVHAPDGQDDDVMLSCYVERS